MASFNVSYAQKPDTAKTDDKTEIKVLEERVKLSEFINKLEQAKLENEYSVLDWLIKSQVIIKNGEYSNAVDYLNKSIELEPNNKIAYNSRGYCYLALEQFKEATEDFNYAIHLDSGFAIAYSNRSRAYNFLNDFNNAVKDIKKAIELNPSLPIYYSNLSTTLILMNKYEEALENIDKAILLSTHDESVLTILYYKKYVILKILNKETKDSEIFLNNLLEKEINLEWFKLDSFVHLLSKIDFSEDIKKFIQEKTELLKEKMK
ncbi:MAG: tetratricopeptide repeat protein [Candidatus Zixiibacteriota bacterium]|nr:MAG: tetratricopeptide repeat protein [candidate division Zixibacteria bacterium]